MPAGRARRSARRHARDPAAAVRGVPCAVLPLRPGGGDHVPGQHVAEHLATLHYGIDHRHGCRAHLQVVQNECSVAGILSLLFLLLAIVAGIIAIFAFGVNRGGPGITLAALGVFGVVMWISGRSMDGLLDGRFVGVRAVSMSKNVQTITLRFRDAGMAVTVAALTERRAQVAGAKQMLARRNAAAEPGP